MGCQNGNTETRVLGLEVIRNGWSWRYFEFKLKDWIWMWGTWHERMRLLQLISALFETESWLGRESQKSVFYIKLKIEFAQISRMNTGMTSYLSCDAVKIMVKEHKWPMLKRMRWVSRWPILVCLQKKMERRECLMKWRKPQYKSWIGL